MRQEKTRHRRKKGPGRMPFARKPKPCNPWNWFMKKERGA